jgi:predicted Zn-dependent protease
MQPVIAASRRFGSVRTKRWWPALALLLLAASPGARADRTKLKPGWNMFSTQDDMALGLKASKDAQKQLPMCNNPQVDAYLTAVGKRLVAKAPTNGVQYPWEFHCVNDKAINAFALPGGYVFVNRGTIEATDNEAQLAAVMAHELSHVVLRHGTNQASKAQAMQLGLGAFGAFLGNDAKSQIIGELAAFSAGSVLLKYSRAAETQADVMGTQILYDAGYDPRAMAQFFEKLEAEGKSGGQIAQFFSDHPNPENRVGRVDEEISKLGNVSKNARRDSSEFHNAKAAVQKLPVVKAKQPAASASAGKPAVPSGTLSAYQGDTFSLKYPDNWQQYSQGNAVSFAPENGVLNDKNGQAALAYGMIISVNDEHANSANITLEAATDQLVASLRKSNPAMQVQRSSERIRLNGQPGEGLANHRAAARGSRVLRLRGPGS